MPKYPFRAVINGEVCEVSRFAGAWLIEHTGEFEQPQPSKLRELVAKANAIREEEEEYDAWENRHDWFTFDDLDMGWREALERDP